MNLATSIRSFYLLILLLFLNCSSSGDDDYNLGNDNNENSLPKLTTYPVTDVKLYSAKSGGNIDGDGGYDIITKGIVWGINPNPTITLSTKTEEGNGSVDFTSEIQNLQQDTQYYVRAYATNSENKTGYGNQRNFNTVDPTIYDGEGVTDIDGNYYSSLIFRHQEWSSVNLSVIRYRNGDEIPQVQDPNEWANLTTGAWCYYNNDPNNESYGKLYNWYAIEDPRGLAPEGWHVPLDSEWETLSSFINLAGYNFISEDFTSNDFAKSVSSTSFQQGTDASPLGPQTPILLTQYLILIKLYFLMCDFEIKE